MVQHMYRIYVVTKSIGSLNQLQAHYDCVHSQLIGRSLFSLDFLKLHLIISKTVLGLLYFILLLIRVSMKSQRFVSRRTIICAESSRDPLAFKSRGKITGIFYRIPISNSSASSS